MDIGKIRDNKTFTASEEPVEGSSKSYHIGSIQKQLATVSRILHYSCQPDQDVNAFIQFYSRDGILYAEIMQ